MPQVGNEKNEQDSLPNAQIGRGSQNESLIEGEEEVQVGKLGEHDGSAGGNGSQNGGRGRVGQEQVVPLSEMGIIRSHEGGNGLDDEEEDAIGQRETEANILLLLGSHDGLAQRIVMSLCGVMLCLQNGFDGASIRQEKTCCVELETGTKIVVCASSQVDRRS